MDAAPSQIPETGRPKKKSGVVIPHQPKWYQRGLAWLIFACIRAVALTLRYRWHDRSGYYDGSSRGPAIYCFWHNRLALCTIVYREYTKKSAVTPGVVALVSASRDGGFLTGVLKWFRVELVRGSSSRRGPQALLELTSWAERGYDLAITPDGPRGPRYIVQEGVTSLAQLTGLPIVPFACNLGWKVSLNSWDRFQIPLPFSSCEVNVGVPVRVPPNATDAEREELRQRLETSLRELSRD
jgi:lysophospholipid acyltransferase (LPLAT)-like uncharacterized protein